MASETITVHVKSLAGDEIVIDVPPRYTISELKEMIQQQNATFDKNRMVLSIPSVTPQIPIILENITLISDVATPDEITMYIMDWVDYMTKEARPYSIRDSMPSTAALITDPILTTIRKTRPMNTYLYFELGPNQYYQSCVTLQGRIEVGRSYSDLPQSVIDQFIEDRKLFYVSPNPIVGGRRRTHKRSKRSKKSRSRRSRQ